MKKHKVFVTVLLVLCFSFMSINFESIKHGDWKNIIQAGTNVNASEEAFKAVKIGTVPGGTSIRNITNLVSCNNNLFGTVYCASDSGTAKIQLDPFEITVADLDHYSNGELNVMDVEEFNGGLLILGRNYNHGNGKSDYELYFMKDNGTLTRLIGCDYIYSFASNNSTILLYDKSDESGKYFHISTDNGSNWRYRKASSYYNPLSDGTNFYVRLSDDLYRTNSTVSSKFIKVFDLDIYGQVNEINDGNGILLLLLQNGDLYRSIDGTSWIKTTTELSYIKYSNGMYYGKTKTGSSLRYSTDAITWITTPVEGTIYEPQVYYNGSFMWSDGLDIYCYNCIPTISAIAPLQDSIYTESDTSFIPQISVSDINNDALTCSYYIDTELSPRETKTVINSKIVQNVSFSGINMNMLSEGRHTIRFEVTDSKESPVTSIISFSVDKSPPALGTILVSSFTDSITVSGSASDNVAGLNNYPYRYKIGSNPTSWLSSNTYTFNNLIPNTKYQVTFEARDNKDHISSYTQQIYTEAEVPVLDVDNATSYTLDLSTTDNNTALTQYMISVNGGAGYIAPDGTLSTSPIWILLSNKKITIKGLEPSTTYYFQVKAKNGDNIETNVGSLSGTTLIPPPAAPTGLIATATSDQITVCWDAVQGATEGYDIMADGNIVDVGTSTTYTHIALSPGTPHTYQVRSKNADGPGDWSTQITKSTLPAPPDIPGNLTAVPKSTSITVVWSNVPGATGYDIEVDGSLVPNGPTTNYIHRSLSPGTCHTYRVRSINSGYKSEWSTPISVTTTQESSPVPINFNATPSQNTISLTWDAVDDATGYDIEVDGVTIDNNMRTSYTHKNLAIGSCHIYRVRSKKNGISSDWSAALVVETLTDVFGVPCNIEANTDDTSIVLSWSPVADAIGYEVEYCDGIMDNGTECSVLISGLEPGTTYTFRVRAQGETESSEWSEATSVRTFDLPAPVFINVSSTETDISMVWNTTDSAASLEWNTTGSALVFDLEADGTIITDITDNSYTCSGLIPGTQHVFRVRARNDEGESNWSIPVTQSTMFSVTDAPAGLLAIVRDTSAVIMWKSMDGIDSYDIEADGAVIENITDTKHIHTGLQPGSSHTYRVRANNDSGGSGWSDLLSVSTKPDGPAVPTNITASSTTSKILVTWDEVTGATEYEIEVDGVIVEIGMALRYLHSGVISDSQHSYRVRSKNTAGYSGWSDLITVNAKSSTMTYMVDCVIGEEFDLTFSATDIQDLGQYTFTISYDTEELEVTDLCGLTSRIDTVAGGIVGTDIQIIQYSPGTIVFKKSASAQSYQVWSGIVNSISFKSLIDGQANVTYSFQ